MGLEAEIIAVGSELTSGAKLDTNSQWLSVQLGDLGITVRRHTTIADDLAENLRSFRDAVEHSDLVLVTGGLGPTLDDLTRDVLAQLADVPLEVNEPVLAEIREFFAKRQRPMPERNSIQAHFPQGSVVLSNPIGTAPGIWIDIPRKSRSGSCSVAALPGVPSEMKKMFLEQVLPRLPESGRVIRRARINCFGAGESHIEEMLGDLTRRGRDPEVGITAHEGTITLRIEAHGSSSLECEEKIDVVRSQIRDLLDSLVVGDEDEDVEHGLIAELNRRRETVAVAEIGTRGLAAQLLANASGTGHAFRGGLVLSSHEWKWPDYLALESMVSPGQRALRVARWIRELSGSDYGIFIGEFPREEELPLLDFRAQIAAAGPGFERVENVSVAWDPRIVKSRTCKVALNLVRLHLLEKQ